LSRAVFFALAAAPVKRFRVYFPQETPMPIPVGSMAPDFTLKSSKMEDVTLSKLRGKPVLLLTYPLAFTPT
jgi:peroxiredoxin